MCVMSGVLGMSTQCVRCVITVPQVCQVYLHCSVASVTYTCTVVSRVSRIPALLCQVCHAYLHCCVRCVAHTCTVVSGVSRNICDWTCLRTFLRHNNEVT